MRAGTTRSGWIAFEIPTQIDRSAVRIVWDRQREDGEIQAYWRPAEK